MNFKFITIILLLLTPYSFTYAQFECGMESIISDSPEFTSVIQNIDFFSQSNCDPYVFNCNFIFLTRADGSGTFAEDSPVVNTLINTMNAMWSSVGDPANCAPNDDYPVDSKIRMNINTHYIANEAAWDYYAQANSLSNYNTNTFCPNNIMNSNTWPALKAEVDAFTADHPNSINFFFVENGAHLEFLENAEAQGKKLLVPWVYHETIPIFDGCSRPASSYNSNQHQFIVIADFYTKWYYSYHFAQVYFPDSNVSNEEKADQHLVNMPKLNNHEIGHIFLGGGHTCLCHNLMIGSGCTPEFDPVKQYLSLDQLEEFHEVLATSNMHKYIECSDDDYCDLIVQQDEIIDQPMSIFGDIYIENGATLIITSEIYLGKSSSIYVMEGSKLILEGATLSSGCHDTWEGIKVVGGNTDFDVKISQQSTIMNTSDAAVSMMPPLPWPEQSNHGNGILHAENSTFENTYRILELVAFQPSQNSSYIKNCIQNGGKRSISNWNCQGVVIEENEFNDIEDICIITHSGSFEIVDNTFHSVDKDIFFADISAGQGTLIRGNNFFGEGTGIYALGTTLDEIRITKNNFNNGKFAIFMDGDNNYEVKKNVIECEIGIVAIENGEHSNNVHSNIFKNNLIGIVTDGNNEGFNFSSNCFDSESTDVSIFGSIAPFIQLEGAAANNCFSHQGSESSEVLDLSGLPNSFVYIEPLDQEIDCKDAILAVPNITTIKIGNPVDACKNDSENTSDYYRYDYCNPNKDIDDLMQSKSWLDLEIQRLQEVGEMVNMLHYYKRCLNKVRQTLFSLYTENKNFSDARRLMQEDKGDNAKVAIYNTFLFENDLVSAKEYLDQLTPASEALNDYRFVQYLYLNQLSRGINIVLDEKKLMQLKHIALKKHSFAAYAKSLYYLLTDELLSSESMLPRVKDENGLFKVSNLNLSNSTFKIFPNPTNDLVNVIWKNKSSLEGLIYVFDMHGQQVMQEELEHDSNQTVLNFSELPQGVYILRVNLGTEESFSQKIIVSK